MRDPRATYAYLAPHDLYDTLLFDLEHKECPDGVLQAVFYILLATFFTSFTLTCCLLADTHLIAAAGLGLVTAGVAAVAVWVAYRPRAFN